MSSTRPPPGRIAKLMADAVFVKRKDVVSRLRSELEEARLLIKALRQHMLIMRVGPMDADRIRELLESSPHYMSSPRAAATADRIVRLLNAGKALPRELAEKVGLRP